ncbi:MAG TPA: TRAP transporter small permease [Syntrophobacter fumaroxidans]|nr:TRAP transporter small permease [Syntrophobacter fumaroxidans]
MSPGKVLDAVDRVVSFISAAFIAVMVSILFYAVVMRYVLHSPPEWSIEITRFMFVWMVFLAAALVSRDDTHLNIGLFIDWLPARFKKPFRVLNLALSLLFCGVLIYQGIKIYPKVAQATSPTFGVSMGWLYLPLTVGSALMCLFIVENIVRLLLDKPRQPASGEK